MDGLKEIIDTLKELLPKLEDMLPEGEEEVGEDPAAPDSEEGEMSTPGKRPAASADDEEGDADPKKALMVSMLRRSLGK